MRFEAQSSNYQPPIEKSFCFVMLKRLLTGRSPKILSIPIGTVMSRLARARKALCELLGRAPCAPLSSGLAHPTRRMLELPKQQRGQRAMRDVAIDQNSHAEELPFDLSERTRLMQIASFVSTRFHGCDLGVRFSNAYFEICRPKTVRPWPDSSKST